MSYITIINEGTVHRRRLEILGLSIKNRSEDRSESIIGQFGSGFKMAIAVALRLNLQVAVASSDERGHYILTFKKVKESIASDGSAETVDIIVYNYSDIGDRETSISLNAFPKWTRSIGENNPYYPIIREFLTNARDEDDCFAIMKADGIKHAGENETIIYIESNKLIEDLILNRDRYFKFFYTTNPVFQISGLGAIYEKSSPDKTRLFVQGCLAKVDSVSSEFDYNIEDNTVLSEERAISSYEMFRKQVAKMIMQMDDPNHLYLLESIICTALNDQDSFEALVIGKINKYNFPQKMKKIFINIWAKLFGEKSVLNSGNTMYDAEAEKLLGYNVVSLRGPMFVLFHLAGILDSRELVEQHVGDISVRDMTKKEKFLVQSIIKKYLYHIKYFRDSLTKYPIKTSQDKLKMVGGLSDYTTIQIEESTFKNDLGNVLIVLLHELRHCTSKLHDSDYRRFLKVAEREILMLIVMLHQALDRLKKEFGVEPKDVSNLFC